MKLSQEATYKQKGEQLYREGNYREAVVETTNCLNVLSERFKNNQIKDEK
jgi:hypothetical protein